ncbi:MAG TPA: hypothetical protein VI197_25550 [Polyangiaceae bacterium]
MKARVYVLAVVALLAQACGGEDSKGELGAPCAEDEDCADGLVCDVHDDRGSCQKPHEH